MPLVFEIGTFCEVLSNEFTDVPVKILAKVLIHLHSCAVHGNMSMFSCCAFEFFIIFLVLVSVETLSSQNTFMT